MKKNIIIITFSFVLIFAVASYKYNYCEQYLVPNISTKKISKENLLPKLTNLNYYYKDTKYKDLNGDTAIIPKEFAVSPRNGENTIKNGLVVIDKNLNEFVFVPVNKNSFLDEDYKEEFKTMFTDIINAGGFFVSRFEMGIKEKDYPDNLEKIYSKQGYFPLHGLYLEEINSLVSNFSKEYNINAMILQDACYEEILKFASNESLNKDSNTIGNYTNRIYRSGYNLNYSTKNIFDLAGNYFEFTLGNKNNEYYYARGGSYKRKDNINSKNFSISSKIIYKQKIYGPSVLNSFRIMFYTK